jgi:hypothetical protein
MLRLRFKKKADSTVTLTAVRQNGTSTSTSIGAHAGFGPVHDLSHYAVEAQMGFANGFLGLLAAGRNFEDFNNRAKDWLPKEALVSEAISGQLSQDSMTGNPLDLETFNWSVADALSRGSVKCEAPALEAAQLAAMHARLADLRRQWDAVAIGDTLELAF